MAPDFVRLILFCQKMNAILTPMVLLAVFTTHAKAEGGWDVSKRADGATYIHIKRSDNDLDARSLNQLLEFIDSLKGKEIASLQHITFTEFFLDDANLQKELLAQFSEGHPKLLKAARESAGNMHNPKVLPLRAVFSESLLKTPTVRKIDQRLLAVGYQISGVSHEKFSLEKGTEPIRFRSFVWLTIKPKAASQYTEPEPAASVSELLDYRTSDSLPTLDSRLRSVTFFVR
jgi:hypothetical protein